MQFVSMRKLARMGLKSNRNKPWAFSLFWVL